MVLVTASVLVLVEPEDQLRAPDEDRALDQVRLLHHEVDRLFLRRRQGPLLEHGTAGAHELQKPLRVDVPFEERAIGRIAIDVAFFDVDAELVQITSGIAAGRSSRLPVKRGLRHAGILEHLLGLQ
jgi:hypothetical protein